MELQKWLVILEVFKIQPIGYEVTLPNEALVVEGKILGEVRYNMWRDKEGETARLRTIL